MNKISNQKLYHLVGELIYPYWQSNDKKTGYLWLCAIILCSSLEVYLSVKLNNWNHDFYDSLQNYAYNKFLLVLGHGFVIMTLYVFASVMSYYCSAQLELNWRKWLTNYTIANWLNDKIFYYWRFSKHSNINTDNPEQRITEDIHQFIKLTIRMILDCYRSCLTLGSFIIILWGFSDKFKFIWFSHSVLIHGYLVWIALFYAIIGTWITFKIGNPLIKLNYQQERYEADLRYNLTHIRDYAEVIAGYAGEQATQKNLNQQVETITNNTYALIQRNLKVNFFSYAYGQLSTIIPTLMAMGKYFAKQLSLGDLMQINSAFMRVEYSIAYLIYIYNDIASWLAVVRRLNEFNMLIKQTGQLRNTIQLINVTNQPLYKIEQLNLFLPSGERLIANFNLTLTSGERLLIQGKSGCGKSILIKTLNQLWPYATGIIYQNYKSSLFIAQKPYLPKLNLKEAICYPLSNNFPSDEQIKHYLRLCDLPQLVDLLYQNHDWDDYLSLGEQQKLAICRVLVNCPQIIYLDEVTSALDEIAGIKLYQLVIDHLPQSIIISVSHHSYLIPLHHQHKILVN
ncbi:MAG: hypothetical protein RLZZ293_870 [Pseudomonadota bacterium]|jgi:putative ATP-binding cassette transporter